MRVWKVSCVEKEFIVWIMAHVFVSIVSISNTCNYGSIW